VIDLSEDEEVINSEPVETVIEMPVIMEGSYYYACEECGCALTEIPYYNRYFCENCGLHY
jgi:hypothetical protein